ncbi:MAG TPA: hypothetical protein VM434_11680 [Beijerinckiaceae bacterium]|nr:hypothetical protein [Beijerinckiaceae bacterium]
MSVGYPNDARHSQHGGHEVPPGKEWDAIKDDVSQLAGEAVDRGKHFIESARDQATGYLDKRKDATAQSVADVAHSLRESCKSFEDRPNIKAFVDSAADGLDHLAGRIRDHSFNELFEEVEQAVRRRPAAVAGMTFFAGFLLARFIKSSAEGIRQAEFERRRAQRRAQSSPGSDYARGRV